MEREIEGLRDYMRAAVEDHGAIQDELRSAHEEMLSATEEFQSTNEELETSKEELQSTRRTAVRDACNCWSSDKPPRVERRSQSPHHSDRILRCQREQSGVSADKELRVQQRGKECVAGLGVETEQALRLRRREAETGHLKVFRADSTQQFFRCHVHTRARNKMALPFAMNLPWDALGENPFHTNDHARGGEESGLTDPPPLQ